MDIVQAFTPQQVAHRLLCAHLKSLVKADVPKLRTLATNTKVAQRKGDNSLVWEHQKAKAEARARLLIYGFVRGKDWGVTESNHPEGVKRIQRWYLKSAWEEACSFAVDAEARGYIGIPPLVAKWVPLG